MNKLTILIILLGLCITGCSVTPQEYKAGERLCEGLGGIEYYIPAILKLKVECKNGARISAYKDESVYE